MVHTCSPLTLEKVICQSVFRIYIVFSVVLALLFSCCLLEELFGSNKAITIKDLTIHADLFSMPLITRNISQCVNKPFEI